MRRIAITGKPGVGKSTIITKVIDKLDTSIGGIQCSEMRKDGKRVGFSIKDIATGETGILSHIGCTGPNVGRYHVNMQDLDGIGAVAVRGAVGCDLVVVDEIGPMELKSTRFISAVEEVLGSDIPMLVVVHHSSRHPLAQRIHKEFEVIQVNEQNRDDLPEIIAGYLR